MEPDGVPTLKTTIPRLVIVVLLEPDPVGLAVVRHIQFCSGHHCLVQVIQAEGQSGGRSGA